MITQHPETPDRWQKRQEIKYELQKKGWRISYEDFDSKTVKVSLYYLLEAHPRASGFGPDTNAALIDALELLGLDQIVEKLR